MFPVQGKVTEAMKEAEPLQYGQLKAKDFIPGTEVLKEAPSEGEEDENGKAITVVYPYYCFLRERERYQYIHTEKLMVISHEHNKKKRG